jgi:hypothetical protein
MFGAAARRALRHRRRLQRFGVPLSVEMIPTLSINAKQEVRPRSGAKRARSNRTQGERDEARRE